MRLSSAGSHHCSSQQSSPQNQSSSKGSSTSSPCLCKRNASFYRNPSASEPQHFNTSILSSHAQFNFPHYLHKVVFFCHVCSFPELLQLSCGFPKFSKVTLVFALFPKQLSLFAFLSASLLHLLTYPAPRHRISLSFSVTHSPVPISPPLTSSLSSCSVPWGHTVPGALLLSILPQ